MRLNVWIASAAVILSICTVAGSAEAAGDAATADLKDGSGKSIGKVEIKAVRGGALIRLKATGLTRGEHAVHVHETGKCEGDFSSAGAIYNPIGSAHGYLSEEGPMAGDLPNLIVPASGEIEIEILNSNLVLSKDADEHLLDDDGAAIVIFEKPDDYATEPEGDAGARIACGVLEPQK